MTQKISRMPIKGSATTHRDLGLALKDLPGFAEGRELQSSIMRLGDRIRRLRESVLGITQSKAARLIGIAQSELSRIESGFGRRGPSFLTITRIIEAYQSYLQTQDPSYHLGLNIQLSRGETAETAQSFLAGSE